MDIKSESEIKQEKLEFDSFQEDKEISADNEANMSLSELDQKPFIKLEERNSDTEFEYVEEQNNIDVIKSEIPMLNLKESCAEHIKISADNEANMSLSELDQKPFIKLEERNSDTEFEYVEEQNNIDVIKSEIPMLNLKESCAEHIKISADNEANMSLSELDQKPFIKLEERNSDTEFEYVEEQNNIDVIKSEIPMLNLKESCAEHIKTQLEDTSEVEKGSKIKSISRGRTQTSIAHDQSIEKDHLENLSCRFCNLIFKSQEELQSHLKSHSKKFKCPHCSYECNRNGNLKRHMLMHGNAKLYKCPECNYEGNFKQNLKSHLLTHTSIKLFKCSECNYECNRKDSLEIHSLIHENIKLFKCSECNYECNQKGQLIRHMNIHGDVKLFKCPDCSYECNRKENLKRHTLYKHKKNVTKG